MNSNSLQQWWLKPQWQEYYQNKLLELGRQRYSLTISPYAFLGRSSFINKTVEINPVALRFPNSSLLRNRIRHAPPNIQQWQQEIAIGLVVHEAAHIRFSNSIPQEPTLGWLWNVLEDERIERLMIERYPHLQKFRELLNDAAWFYTDSSSNLLVGCLLWRWEFERLPQTRKFLPANQKDLELWKYEIKLLVETAWEASDSDEVIAIAKDILNRLDIPENKALSSNIPFALWGGSKNILPPQSSITNTNSSTGSSSSVNSSTSSSNTSGRITQNRSRKPVSPPLPIPPREASPDAILAQVEGYARDLAHALKPPTPKKFRRPHVSRGELNLDRALQGHQRPFDFKQAPAPARSVAMLVLIDRSDSMKGQSLKEAIATTLLLDRASEIAGITFGVWGFNNLIKPTIYRSLEVGHNQRGQRLIAGIQAQGGTYLTPVFQKATQTLIQRPEQIKFLILFHDGLLNQKRDISSVGKEVKVLRQKRVFFQPIYIGNNPQAKKSNKQVFGQVLACSDVSKITPLILSWLRALF